MLLAGFLVELCVYCNLFQDADILKTLVLTCFCEIQPVHSRCTVGVTNSCQTGHQPGEREQEALQPA